MDETVFSQYAKERYEASHEAKERIFGRASVATAVLAVCANMLVNVSSSYKWVAFQYLDLTFYIPAAGGLICAIKASYLLIRYYMFPPDYGNMPKPTFVKPWLDKMATEGLNYHQAEVKLRNNLTHYYAETASRNAAVNEQQIALIKGAIVMSLWTLIFAVIATLGYYLIKQRFPEKKTQVKLVAASFQSTRIYA